MAKSVCLCDFFFLLQLLRPYDYNCPRLFEVFEKSKQEPEYVSTAKKYKVRLGSCVVILLFCLGMDDIVLKHWSNAVGNVCSQHVDSMSPM